MLRSVTAVILGTMLAACIQPPTADGGDASVDRAPPPPDLVATDSTPADASRPEVGPDIVVMEVGTRPDAQQAFDVALDTVLDATADAAVDAPFETANDVRDGSIDEGPSASDVATDARVVDAPATDAPATDTPVVDVRSDVPGDAGPPAVARLVFPLSDFAVTSHRPDLRWALTDGDGAAVQVCRDRACTMVVSTFDAVGTHAITPVALARGVYFWRIFERTRGTRSATPSFTWHFRVGARDSAVNTA